MQGQAGEGTQVVGVSLGICVVFVQIDDVWVPLGVGRTRHADATDQMVDDTTDEEGGIRHVFGHLRGA